jgi:hypothetical protein
MVVQGGLRFGPQHARAVHARGYSNGSLRNLASYAKRVPPPNRRADMPHAMHQPVASLDWEEQPRWLQAAKDNGWSMAQLRAAVHDGDPAPAAPKVCPTCGRPW